MIKHIFSSLLIFCLFTYSHPINKKPEQAPRNPKYKAYVAKTVAFMMLGNPIKTPGMIPAKFDESHIFVDKPIVDVPRRNTGDIYNGPNDGALGDPTAALDWRDNNGNFVSAIKDQGTCASCWIFAAVADLESQLLIAGFPSWTLSEEDIKECGAWRTCNGNTNYGAFAYLTLHGVHLDDGSSQSGEAYVDDPDPPCNRNNPYLEKIIVTEWQAVSNSSVANIQANIETYGPLKCNIDSAALADTSNCICNQDDTSTDHSILIVGWDDNMSCTHQTDGSCEETGGWIIKNSWGSSYGDSGYNKIGYDSGGVGGGTFRITGFKYADPEEKIYAYDEAGLRDVYGFGNTDAYGLCKFTADREITIEAIDVYATGNTTNFVVYLYDGFDGTDLGNQLTTENYGPTSRIGYYSVALTSPQTFQSGDDIVVVVKATTTGYNYPIAVDDVDTDYVDIESGKCYVSDTAGSGSWTDTSTFGTPADVALRCRGRFRAGKHTKATSGGSKIIKK